MCRSLVMALALAWAATASEARAQLLPPPSFGSNYQQVWAQDFSAMTSLSQLNAVGGYSMGGATWISHTPSATDWFTFIDPNTSSPAYNPFNVGNGYLTIRAANRGYGDPNNWFGGYSSGLLSSMDSSGRGFAQQYGYFEASMETPGGANTWPSFWLNDAAALTNPGLNDAEIDVTESYGNWGAGAGNNPPGNPNYSQTTWHNWAGSSTTGAGSYTYQPGMTTGFHTYGVDVEPTGITWYFDRQEVWSAPFYAAAGHPLYVLLDLALGGGNYNNATGTAYDWSLTPSPSDLKVQYVAVWASPNSPNYLSGPAWKGGSGNWADPSKWSMTVPGATSGTANTDKAVFNTASAGTVTVDGYRNVQGIIFDGGAGAFTLTGGKLLLSSGGAVTLGVTSASFTGANTTETVNTPITLEGSYTFTNNGLTNSDALCFGGTITHAVPAGATLTLSGANLGANTISGVISNGYVTAPMALTKNGGGTWILASANTFTGPTTINSGALQLNNSLALQNSQLTIGLNNGLTFGSGLGNSYVATLVGGNTETLQDGPNSGGAPVTLNIGTWLNNLSNQYNGYNGTLTGSGGIVKCGATSQWFYAANTYTGATTVAAGGLYSAAPTAITTPFGAGPVSIGAGAFIGLAPATASTTANWTLASGVTSGAAFTYGPGTTVSLTKNDASSPFTLTIGGGSAAALVRGAGGTLLIKTSTGDLGSGENFVFNGAAPAITNGIVNPSIASAGASTANTIDFLGYSNGFRIAAYNARTASFTGAAGNVYSMTPSAAGQTISGSAYALQVNTSATGGNPAGISGTFNLGDNAAGHQAGLILNAGPSANPYNTITVLTGGTINFGRSQGIVWANNGSGYDVLSTSTVFSGSGGLIVAGIGTLNLGGNANTFAGGLAVSGGALSAAADSAFGDASNGIALQGGSLTWNSTPLSTGRSLVITGVSSLNNVCYAGNISGGGYLASATATILTGNNSIAGFNLSNSPPLGVASDANLGGPSSSIYLGGSNSGLKVFGNTLHGLGSHFVNWSGNTGWPFTFDIANPSNTFTIAQEIAGSGNFQAWGPGTIVIAAPSTSTGAVTVEDGMLMVDSTQGGTLPTGALSVQFGGNLYLKGAAAGTSQTVSGVTVKPGGGAITVDNNGGTHTLACGALTLGTLTDNNSTNSNGATLGLVPTGSGVSTLTTTSVNGPGGILGTGRIVYGSGTSAGFAYNTTNASGGAIGALAGTPTSVLDATLSSSANYDLNTRGSVVQTANVTVNSLRILSATGSACSLAQGGSSLALASGALLYNGADNYTISGGSVRSATNVSLADVVIHQYGAGTLTISSAVALSPDPAGQTASTAANSNAITGLSDTSGLYVGMPVISSDLPAGTIITSIDSATAIHVSQNTAATDSAASLKFSSLNNLTKAGPGTLVLSGSNFANGQIYVNGGVLSVANVNSLGQWSGTLKVTSTSSSPAVASAAPSLPPGFAVGSSLLGRTVWNISGSSGGWNITLSGNANASLSGGSTGWSALPQVNLDGGVLQATASMTLNPIYVNTSGGTIDATNGSSVTVPLAQNVYYVAPGALTVKTSDNSSPNVTIACGYSYGNPALAEGLTIDGGNVTVSKDTNVYSLNMVRFGNNTASTESLALNGNSQTLYELSAPSANVALKNGNASSPVTVALFLGDNETYAGVLANGGSASLGIVKDGCGTWTLANSGNSYTGATAIRNGAISVSNIGSAGSNGGLGAAANNGTAAGAPIQIGYGASSGTLVYTGSGSESYATPRDVNLAGLAGGTTVDMSGSGKIKFGNVYATPSLSTAVAGAANKTLFLQGSTTGIGEFDGAIVDSSVTGGGSGVTSLDKRGTGEWILAGTNTYSGGTYVEEGTLIAKNSAAILDGSSLVVGAGGVSAFDPAVGGTSPAFASESGSVAGVAPVPEPGTIVLLLAASTVSVITFHLSDRRLSCFASFRSPHWRLRFC